MKSANERRKTLTEREVELSAAFVDAFYEDVSILDDIPNGVTLALLTDDDPELFESSLQIAESAARRGADVYIRHFARIKPTP